MSKKMKELNIKIESNMPLKQLIEIQKFWSKKYDVVSIVKGK